MTDGDYLELDKKIDKFRERLQRTMKLQLIMEMLKREKSSSKRIIINKLYEEEIKYLSINLEKDE